MGYFEKLLHKVKPNSLNYAYIGDLSRVKFAPNAIP